MFDDEPAFRVYEISFDRHMHGEITVYVGYANPAADHLQISVSIEAMLLMFGRCGFCGKKFDRFSEHRPCMFDRDGEWRGCIPAVIPISLFEHVNKERRREGLRDKSREQNTVRKAKLDAIGEKHTKAEIAALFELQRGHCYYCFAHLRDVTGKPSYTKDHFVAVMRGGGNGIHNIVLACRPCNTSKIDKDAVRFRAKALREAPAEDKIELKALHERHAKAYRSPVKQAATKTAKPKLGAG